MIARAQKGMEFLEPSHCCVECYGKHKSTAQGFRIMIVCPDCGNKRCPKATNHELSCTVSNDTGQPGSCYR